MPNGDTTTRPPDGRGIRWSTLTRKVRKIRLANDETIELPVISAPFGPGTPSYAGYEVELAEEVTVGDRRIRKIQVWVAITDPPPPNGRVDWRGWCHGLTFDETIYSPTGSEVPVILLAGWDEIPCAQSRRGDIIVYYDSAGNVTHSAVDNGDGTYTSKAGNNPQKNDETKANMDRMYRVPPGTTKCYRKRS